MQHSRLIVQIGIPASKTSLAFYRSSAVTAAAGEYYRDSTRKIHTTSGKHSAASIATINWDRVVERAA